MKLRLAGEIVTGPAHRAWVAGPRQITAESGALPGTPVALGPADAAPEQITGAVTELSRLLTAHGPGLVAAGAGVDLGGGFTSARLAGAPGDQRDAVLAALQVLGLEHAHRLGDRAGVLVALFGADVTKRVGAAAARAIDEGRWAAVHLAVAASDVLGPEQLERILDLPAGDVTPDGPPSALARHLGQVLTAVPKPRRLDLLLDLWAEVGGLRARLARADRLRATQARQDRTDDLRRRRKEYEDQQVLRVIRTDIWEPSLADAARWSPPDWYWHQVLNRLLQDAFATTVLLHTVVAITDLGLEAGLRECKSLLGAASAQVSDTPKATGLAARPGTHVRDIARKLSQENISYAYVRPRLARAREYARLIVEEIRAVQYEQLPVPDKVWTDWAERGLEAWRTKVGYTTARRPAEWDHLPLRDAGLDRGPAEPLARRLGDGQDPAKVEQVGDFLWYADLLDAQAAFNGDEQSDYYRAGAVRPEPLTPSLESVSLAVSGAAQLVAFGGTPARGVRTWTAFAESLRASAAVGEGGGYGFEVPAPIAALDGSVVAGGRIRVARSARMLAEWSDYMGNCIAGPDYVRSAERGRCALVALYDTNGQILLNADLRPPRRAAQGWHIAEMAARFNNEPDSDLAARFRSWVAGIPGPTPPEPETPDETPRGRAARSGKPRLVPEVAPALGPAAERAWRDQATDEVLAVFAALAGTPADAALIRLRRLTPAGLRQRCRDLLARDAANLPAIWAATEVRPLADAVQALDPALRDRFGTLDLLLTAEPLPRALRILTRRPAVAPAYNLGLVGLRVRAALGDLVRADDPVLARAVSRRPAAALLCALATAATCASCGDIQVTAPGSTAVPGYPAGDLCDPEGPWQRGLPVARELGADTEGFGEQGLYVPASWLGAGGWPALWARAHHR